ncbi:glutamate 5-kinase [Deminuibacter soli]|uniref:Glutamate 5-kinase n=1 Tax=Deminuibacter soli TaxID=2291815 RepID=A0A3E1NHS1_9BACT|nr:glutamate 5-kinase [Deminuibacter soli]RFM27447.1 glutamate 5-kinase [Deminuibacter soli]
MAAYKKLVIKIGSNVLTRENGLPHAERISELIDEMAALKQQGIEVILVSSGAVAAGRSMVKVSDKYDIVAARQLLASVGQIQLISNYERLFRAHDITCSQVLVTREDFRDRLHYRNIYNCFDILLKHSIIPVVNENDVVSVTELMFTDNDELAGLIASMMKADALIILTNVDGLYTGHPADPASQLIEAVTPAMDDLAAFISSEKSNFGRGGMLTKCNMARKIAGLGIAVHIANGTKPGILQQVLNNSIPHTSFLPFEGSVSGSKRWMAHAGNYAKAVVHVNKGAGEALRGERAASLLPVGITAIEGEFRKKDLVRIVDENHAVIGVGIAEYGSDKAQSLLGMKNQKPLVHYDYLYLHHH